MFQNVLKRNTLFSNVIALRKKDLNMEFVLSVFPHIAGESEYLQGITEVYLEHC